MPRKVFKEPTTSRYQMSFLPPCLNDVVPRDAAVRTIVDVVGKLDCSALLAKYTGGGAPAYDPRTMLMILILAYSEGIHSSRQIEQRCVRDIHYMFVAEMAQPNHQTICRFRRNNEATIKKLFLETVQRCQTEGLVLLEQVAIDGTKIEANVSSKETYNQKRVGEAIEYSKACIDRILKEAEEQDAADEQGDVSGQLPLPGTDETGQVNQADQAVIDKPVSGNKRVVAKLKRRIERARAAEAHMHKSGDKTGCATDLESRVMNTKAGNRPAFNAQACVDGAHQIIVAAVVTQDYNDTQQIAKVLPAIIANTGCPPECLTADSGYGSTETLMYLDEVKVTAFIAEKEQQKEKAEYVYDADRDELRKPATATTAEVVLVFDRKRQKDGKTYRVYCNPVAKAAARAKSRKKSAAKRAAAKVASAIPPTQSAEAVVPAAHNRTAVSAAMANTEEATEEPKVKSEIWLCDEPAKEMALRNAMHERMESASGKETYSLRQQIVEPVFGHMKTVLNLRRLSLRGLAGANIEFLLACAAHNLKKLARALGEAPRGTPAVIGQG